MKVPVAEGGAGADNVGYVLAMEAIAEACASTAVVLASSNLTVEDPVRPRLARAEGAVAEAVRRGQARPSELRAERARLRLRRRGPGDHRAADGDACVLDGSKMWITSGAHAGVHVVFARTDPSTPGPEGISCFVVENGTPGLLVGKEEDKMGQRASGTVGLHFEECRVPGENLVGALGGGYAIALSALGAGRVGIAALSLGLAEAAFAAGVEYAQQRRAFGKSLTEFQNTRFVLADSRMELDAAWLLTLRAARLLDQGDRASAESSMAKLFATEACGRVVDRMVQVHGGYGYSSEYAIERIYRDARVTRIYEGTSEVQRLVISKHLV